MGSAAPVGSAAGLFTALVKPGQLSDEKSTATLAALATADHSGHLAEDAMCSCCFEPIGAPSTAAADLGVPRRHEDEHRAWRDHGRRLRDENAPCRPWMRTPSSIVLTSCGHVFHARCLASWEVSLALKNNLPPTSCIICRAAYASACGRGAGAGAGARAGGKGEEPAAKRARGAEGAAVE